MKQSVRSRILSKRPAGLFVLFLLVLGLGGCLIQPAPLPPKAPYVTTPLRLVVPEEQLREIICEAFQDDMVVDCGGPESWSNEELTGGPSAVLNARIVDSSRDLWRNTGISLASFTTALVVTTSGTVEYTAVVKTGAPEPARQSWRSRGRVGMWSVIPFYTGLAATWIGTAMNEYRLPEKLRAECLARKNGTASAAQANYKDFDPCAEYRVFLRDSYAGVHLPLRDMLARTPLRPDRMIPEPERSI